MFELDAYLERLGLSGPPDWFEIHRAHGSSIPFENLDPHRGVPVSLDEDSLVRKLVSERRGGYCFEQNLLLRCCLERLGATVEPLLARVRWGVPEGVTTPRAHLVLRVELGGRAWLADAGFGAGTLIEPIPFGRGGPYEQAGWRFRVIGEDSVLTLQTEADGEWRDVYTFSTEPVPRVDIEVSNWFTATHPDSRFVKGLLISRHHPDGTRVALTDLNGLTLAVRTSGHSMVTDIRREMIPSLLEQHFGLSGFELGADGRVRLA